MKLTPDKIRNIIKLKESMTEAQKLRLLTSLKHLKEEFTGNVGGETDIANADNLVSEDVPDSPTQNVVAKTFDTKSDFDSYVNQHRGIQMTSKEVQAVVGFRNAKPTQQDRFFVKYESTDDFGSNNTTVVKKLKEGNQFCWTAFSKNEQANDEGQPEGAEQAPEQPNQKPIQKPAEKPVAEQEESQDELTVNDPIRITKSITFVNDVEGARILGDFLRKLDL